MPKRRSLGVCALVTAALAAAPSAAYRSGQLRLMVNRPFRLLKDCAPASWEGEQTLDVEAGHGMAPAADIRYYGAQSCADSDLRDALTQVVNQDRAQIVSNSWSGPEESEGMSFLFSTGDFGDNLALTGLRQADYRPPIRS